MGQFERRGVEKISVERKDRRHACGSAFVRLRSQFTRRAVKRVAHYWVPERRHVHANLVRASRLDPELDERKLAVGRIDLAPDRIMRHGFAAAKASRRHARAFLRVATDGAL